MEIKRFNVDGKLGSILSTLSVIPDKPKGTLCIFHGMGEHKERYLEFAKWLAEKGYAVFVHDHRKHGQSLDEFDKLGIFKDSDRWEYVIDDCHFVVKEARKQVKNVPLVVLGHSMGSIIARRYIAKYTALPKAAIIMGTLPYYSKGKAFVPLTLAKTVRLFTKKDTPSPFLAKVLNDPLAKGIKDRKTELDWLSTDEENVKKYQEDELCGYAYNSNFYVEFFKGIVEANNSVSISETRNIPILFIAGKDDPVGNYGEGVEEVYSLYGGHGFFDLTLKLIPKMRHEILNEKDKMTTYKYIHEWLESVV